MWPPSNIKYIVTVELGCAAMDQSVRQPDFGRLASNFRDIGDHVERFVNLPAVDGGAQLITRMDVILEEIRLLRGEVRTLDRKVTIS